jgi:outer membrane lipase/esterase
MKYRSAITAAGLVFASSPALSQTFSQFFGFGDSSIDSGAYRVLASPRDGAAFNVLWPGAIANGAGKPTSSPGLMSSEALAAVFGLTAIPSDQGGTDYATSGAKNVTTP